MEVDADRSGINSKSAEADENEKNDTRASTNHDNDNDEDDPAEPLAVSDFHFGPCQLRPGMLWGNRFKIVLRDCNP